MIEAKMELVTPQVARQYLVMNVPNNRNIRKDRVDAYARTILSGGWSVTHQGIAFDENGKLVDGQHRLLAIIRADTPIQMLVVRGVPHDEGTLLNIDLGKGRSDQDLLKLSGIDDPVRKDMVSVVRSWWYHKKPGRTRPTAAEVQNYITRHYNDISRLYEMSRIRKHGGGSSTTKAKNIQGVVGAALLAAMYRGVSDDVILKFCNIYRNNKMDGCENYNPSIVLNLRDYVRTTKNTDPNLFSYIENCIRAFANNHSRVRIKEDCYPYDPDLDV